MSDSISRRGFAAASAATVLASSASADPPAAPPPAGPVEAAFARDYPPPSFKPSWKKQQVNRQLVQDFVIYAHSDLPMVKKLLEKEPAVLNGMIDWGGGDWESGLGGAAHMGRRDIVEYLLEKGARPDLFCAVMLGQLATVQAFLKLQPALIDAKGPHGFTLHWHANAGGEQAKAVLDHLQTIKKVEVKPFPVKK